MKFRDLLITEEVIGKFAKVYHRTHTHENVQTIKDDGFKSGPRAMYGPGIYATYALVSQLNPYMVEQYGDFIIKSRVNLEGFLILDPDVAKQVYGGQYRLAAQAKRFKAGAESYRLPELDRAIYYGERTSTIARHILERNMITGMRGIVYTGARDGRCVVCYEFDTIIPMAWTQVTMADIEKIRSQPMVGKVEREFAANLTWEKIINRSLVAKAMQPNADRDLVTQPDTIKHVVNPTPEQQLAAVNADPAAIRFIKHPTPEAQFAATSKNPDMITYIVEPTPEAILMPLMVMMDNKVLLDRLDPATILAALRLSCRILPAVVRGNPTPEPTPAQWQTAWSAPDADEMISMYLPSIPNKQFDTTTIPPDALQHLLTEHPAHLHYFKSASPAIVAAAVLSPKNLFGNLALSNCAVDHIRVDCSAVPEEKLRHLVQEQPFLIYAIADVSIPVVAQAMRKDRQLAQDLARNHKLPPELQALIPTSGFLTHSNLGAP